METVKNYFVGIASFLISIIVFLFIISLIFAYTNMEDRFIDSGVFIAMGLSAFISSFILGKKQKKKGILHGVLVNAICVLILFVISCILNQGVKITNTLGIYIAICVLSGIVGGILGVNV